MTIRQQGGVFGRNPTFNDVEAANGTFDAITTGDFLSYKDGVNVAVIQSGTTATAISTKNNSRQWAVGTGFLSGGAEFDIVDLSAGAGRVQIDTAGNVKVLTGNLVIGTSGKGIDFSATSGTGTSELFDDYEEGTWTPASATNCTVNGVTSAFYTKVGRMVHCYCYVNITTTGLNFTISGLPYVCTNGFGPANLYYLTNGGSASIYGSQQNYVNNGSSDLKLGLGATVTSALVMLTASYYN